VIRERGLQSYTAFCSYLRVRKVNALKQCVTKMATGGNMMLYNTFLKQAAAVNTTSSHEVSFRCTTFSVVAGQCGVLS
jgi:hypothetical protein